MTRRKRRPGKGPQRMIPGVSWPYRMGFIIMAAREEMLARDPSEDMAKEFRRRAEPLRQHYLTHHHDAVIMEVIYDLLGRDWKPNERWARKLAELDTEEAR